ncbi:hypothetical protein [Streptomyces sp. NPDC059533]|uniref:hypothetical protein n=1 Tax=unclassified Streptomyces TaxID=2593676 RepID=UPI0036B31491
MQTIDGLPASVSITALNLREDAYAVLCLPCGGGGAPTTIETIRGPWARPDAWMVAQQHADGHDRRREEIRNDQTWRRQAAALGWSQAQADVMWWASRGHLHHDQAGYYRMDPTDPRARRGRPVARARVLSLVDAGFLDHDGEQRTTLALTRDGRDARKAWNHALPDPAEVESRYLRPLLDGEEDTHRRRILAQHAERRAAEQAERDRHQPAPVEPAAAPTPPECPHTPVWLVLAASVTGQLSHRMECACGATQALYPGKSPSMDRGTGTRPAGIREASVTMTAGWARQQGYEIIGPWTVLDEGTKRAPIQDGTAPVHIPVVTDPNRRPPTPVDVEHQEHEDVEHQEHGDVERQEQGEVEHHQEHAHVDPQPPVPAEHPTAADPDAHAAASENFAWGDVTADERRPVLRPVEILGTGTGRRHTTRTRNAPRPAAPTQRRGRRPTPKGCGQYPPAPTRQQPEGADNGILEPSAPTPAPRRQEHPPVIPHGRLALTEDDIATLTGTSLKTWRRNEATAFRARVAVVNPGDRLRLYDREQTLADIAGRPLPPLPEPGDHPDDLLTAGEAGDVLGVNEATVRAYATTGHLSPGVELYGRRWWPRREVDARRDAGDQRSAPSTTAVQALAEQLTTDTNPPTAAELAARDNISTRTARRRINAARTQLTSEE